MTTREKLKFVSNIFKRETNVGVDSTFTWTNGALFIMLSKAITMKEALIIQRYFQGYGLDEPKFTCANNGLCIELTESMVNIIYDVYYVGLAKLVDEAKDYFNKTTDEAYVEACLYANRRWSIFDIQNAMAEAKKQIIIK